MLPERKTITRKSTSDDLPYINNPYLFKEQFNLQHKDQNPLIKSMLFNENALNIANYILAMRTETNLSDTIE